jgi:hypothetical protein
VTHGNVAVLHGSPVPDPNGARVSARARARASVAEGDDARVAKAARIAARGPALPVRLPRVVYLDAADSWLWSESTPSIRQVWATDYSSGAPAGWLPFVVWCKAYRLPAVVSAALLDSIKWMLIHPVRGPLFLAATGGGVAAIVLT